MSDIDKNFEITLPGETLVRITQEGSDRITLETASGKSYLMYHSQDCCESVSIYDIAGELDSLIGDVIIEAKETISSESPEDIESDGYEDESCTWTTFYLATKDSAVAIRWLGSSNGYYSESVSFVETTP